MTTYTLSIEDKVRTGTEVTERAVNVAANGSHLFEESYNPNAKPKKPFNYEDKEFDTPFSPVHPFRKLAKKIVLHHHVVNVGVEVPELRYDGNSVNIFQKKLFENILAQEYGAVKKQENKGYIPRAWDPLD